MTGSGADRIIVALDTPDWEGAEARVDRLPPECRRFKVGKQLFTREGPRVVDLLRERGKEVFLDLKFHDIPNTVAGACQAAAEVGAWMVTIHASGGPRMMEAAREAVAGYSRPPWLLGVTVLTSMDGDELRAVGVTDPPEVQVLRLARVAWDSGLDGVIASPREVGSLRAELDPGFLVVTPGIRPTGAGSGDDQLRAGSAGQAVSEGSDYLVVGRPLTQLRDPIPVWRSLVDEIDRSG